MHGGGGAEGGGVKWAWAVGGLVRGGGVKKSLIGGTACTYNVEEGQRSRLEKYFFTHGLGDFFPPAQPPPPHPTLNLT